MPTILIATDEAGYGPKLGPLVITATVWEIPGQCTDEVTLNEFFAPLRTPYEGPDGPVVVDDSKAVFKPSQGLSALHTAVSAAIRWSGKRTENLIDWISVIAAKDVESILQTPWFEDLGSERFLGGDETDALVDQWSQSGLRLLNVSSRIISARQFNSRCADGFNKADLLSESTIGLVRSVVDSVGSESQQVIVFCDRHGGRRYYGLSLIHI